VVAKLLQRLPGGVLVEQPASLDADIADPAPLLGTHSSLRLRKDAAMENGGMTPSAVDGSPR
jgi:hypothetical protein